MRQTGTDMRFETGHPLHVLIKPVVIARKDRLTISTSISRDSNDIAGRQLPVTYRHIGQNQVVITLTGVRDGPDFFQ
jgi:hypothetical protein